MVKILSVSFIVGILFGVVRYWLGFFPIGHALFAALAAIWMASLFIQSDKAFRMREGVFVLFVLMIGEMVGFGISQPWFDPFDWLMSVLEGDTAEHMFGIALVGGVVGKEFHIGVNGGFWVLFNLIDLFFLWLFTMFGLNSFIYRKMR